MSERPQYEIWECVVPGTVIVWTWDANRKEYRTVRCSGTKAPRRIRITPEDREYNQSLIPPGNEKLDPFTNGRLAKVGTDGKLQGAATIDDLRAMLADRGQLFEEGLKAIADDELMVRRLKDLAESEGTGSQLEAINEIIDERYRLGGTQRTIREMMAEEERDRGLTLT